MDWGVEPTLVTFFIPLLDRVGLPHGSTFTIRRDELVPWLAGIPIAPKEGLQPRIDEEGRSHVSMMVWRPKETATISMEPLNAVSKVFRAVTGQSLYEDDVEAIESVSFDETAGTVITAVTPLIRDEGEDLAEAAGKAFDRCLEEISTLVRAYVTEMGATYVRLVSRRNVYPFVVYWLRHAFDPDVGGEHRMLSIHGGMSQAQALSAAEVEEADLSKVVVNLSRIKQGDPFQAASEQFYRARRAYWVEGDFAATVSAAYTAGEVLLNSLLLLLEWEKGTARAVTKAWFEEQGLTKRLRTYYHPSLGGSWDPKNSTGMIGKWMALAELRGRVVHAGYWPTEQEAEAALEMMGGLSDFVKGRLAIRLEAHPRTALLLLGEPGLRRLGKWRGKIKRFVEEEAGAEDPWIASFREWLNESAAPSASRIQAPSTNGA
jgi:hypothetical protein